MLNLLKLGFESRTSTEIHEHSFLFNDFEV